MAKITSAICKDRIVAYVVANGAALEKEFVLETPEQRQEFKELYKQAYFVSNWKRMYKSKNRQGNIERGFDCKPFDDQLRGYVETDATDSTILRVYVCGE